jgi:putative restriction endonuclease
MSKPINEYLEAQVIKAYLIDGHSHRRIQEEILDIPAPARGGGFEAMKILHSYGIQGDKKAILCSNSFEEERETASASYKHALLLIKKYFLD